MLAFSTMRAAAEAHGGDVALEGAGVDLVQSGLIDRTPRTIRDDRPVGAALDAMLDAAPSGLPVIDAAGRYLGACTLRSVTSLCLLVKGETAALMSSLGFLREDLARLRQRLGTALDGPVVAALDPYVPVLRPNASLAELFFLYYRNNPLVPVVDDAQARRLVGTVTWDRALRLLREPA
ncbi:MAG TPA: CBS domain-containing protein [Alphaproteobacteria bacterium]|jgi:CBS domain-containing protein|nr:CBS domain-containing protein [Alphaproteobacteria bacterium]